MTTGGNGNVSIGAILSRAFCTIARAPAATLGVVLLFGTLPSLGLRLLAGPGALALQEPIGSLPVWIGAILYGVLVVAGAVVVQGALARLAVAHGEGRRAGFAEAVAAAFRMLLPLVLVGLVVAGGTLIGAMILLFPGIMIYIAWSVAVPAMVEEERGVFDALRRSRDLTRGHRWRVFALFAVAFILYALMSWLLGAVVGLIFGEAGAAAFASDGEGAGIAVRIVGLAASTLATAAWGTLLGALYVELRTAREGPATEALAEIFR